MPCTQNCNNRNPLVKKEEKLEKLNQTKNWLAELNRQEPWRRPEVIEKTRVVDNMLATTMAETEVPKLNQNVAT